MLEGIGYIPRGPETQIYSIDETDLSLVATAEITLGGLLAGQTLDAERAAHQALRHQPLLPHRGRRPRPGHAAGCTASTSSPRSRCSPSRCPRRARPCSSSFRDLECRLFDGLGIPYRVVDTATGDLGGPAYRKFDLEAWMPGRDEYGEVTSTSNCTDYQARRLNIRYESEGREGHPASSTPSTARPSPISRAAIAVLENYQQADGSILIPEVLQPVMGRKRIEAR